MGLGADGTHLTIDNVPYRYYVDKSSKTPYVEYFEASEHGDDDTSIDKDFGQPAPDENIRHLGGGEYAITRGGQKSRSQTKKFKINVHDGEISPEEAIRLCHDFRISSEGREGDGRRVSGHKMHYHIRQPETMQVHYPGRYMMVNDPAPMPVEEPTPMPARQSLCRQLGCRMSGPPAYRQAIEYEEPPPRRMHRPSYREVVEYEEPPPRVVHRPSYREVVEYEEPPPRVVHRPSYREMVEYEEPPPRVVHRPSYREVVEYEPPPPPVMQRPAYREVVEYEEPAPVVQRPSYREVVEYEEPAPRVSHQIVQYEQPPRRSNARRSAYREMVDYESSQERTRVREVVREGKQRCNWVPPCCRKDKEKVRLVETMPATYRTYAAAPPQPPPMVMHPPPVPQPVLMPAPIVQPQYQAYAPPPPLIAPPLQPPPHIMPPPVMSQPPVAAQLPQINAEPQVTQSYYRAPPTYTRAPPIYYALGPDGTHQQISGPGEEGMAYGQPV